MLLLAQIALVVLLIGAARFYPKQLRRDPGLQEIKPVISTSQTVAIACSVMSIAAAFFGFNGALLGFTTIGLIAVVTMTLNSGIGFEPINHATCCYAVNFTLGLLALASTIGAVRHTWPQHWLWALMVGVLVVSGLTTLVAAIAGIVAYLSRPRSLA